MKWYTRTVASVLPTPEDVKNVPQYASYGGWRDHLLSLDGDALFKERAIIGSPETVAKKIRYLRDEGGLPMLLPFFNFGTLPLESVKKSMTLFSREVMPALSED